MIMALVFVTVFGLAMAATLGYADTAFRTDQRIQERQTTLYGANGALDTAINAMRSDLAWGEAGEPCAPMSVDVAGGQPASVTCTARGSAGSGVPATSAPPHALLSNSRPAEPGISINSGVLDVAGAVVTASAITIAPGAQLDANGSAVHAGGPCPVAQIVADPTAICSQSTSTEIADAYTTVGAPAFVAPAVRAAPACPGAGGYVALDPGQYTDALALSRLTNGSCPGAVIHLRPGTFWFNFTQRGLAGQWRITDQSVDVVAGTPSGWSAGPWAVRPALPTAGACNASSPQGALLVFSGESQLYVGAAHNVELCASATPSGQRFAIYGPAASTGAPPAQRQNRCVTLPRGCPFIMVTGASAGATSLLRVHGTVLAPRAAIGVDFTRGGQAAFDRGVLVRSVTTWGTAPAAVSPVFSAPAVAGAIPDRVVELEVTIGGVRVGRALVRFGDGGGATPGATVTVEEWNVTV